MSPETTTASRVRAGVPVRTLVLPTTARILLVAFTFRLVSAFIAFFANITLPLHTNQGFTVLGRPHPFWDTFARFDSGWYFGIASKGYSYVEGGRNNLAFFPLYPTLMGFGGRLLGGRQEDFYFAGIVISWLAFAVAMVPLYRLARLDLGYDASLRAAAYCAVFPSAHFFGVVYSESLFLLTLVGAVLALRQRRWGWAALSGMAMTATRVNGVMLVPGLLVIAWLSAKPDRTDRLQALAAAAAASVGWLAFCVYAYALSGDPLAWYHSIEQWGYYPGGNPATGLLALAGELFGGPIYFLSTNPMAPYDTLNMLSAVVALALLPLVWRRFNAGYAAIIALGLLLPLSSGQYRGTRPGTRRSCSHCPCWPAAWSATPSTSHCSPLRRWSTRCTWCCSSTSTPSSERGNRFHGVAGGHTQAAADARGPGIQDDMRPRGVIAGPIRRAVRRFPPHGPAHCRPLRSPRTRGRLSRFRSAPRRGGSCPPW